MASALADTKESADTSRCGRRSHPSPVRSPLRAPPPSPPLHKDTRNGNSRLCRHDSRTRCRPSTPYRSKLKRQSLQNSTWQKLRERYAEIRNATSWATEDAGVSRLAVTIHARPYTEYRVRSTRLAEREVIYPRGKPPDSRHANGRMATIRSSVAKTQSPHQEGAA
jgi:hypothetical protein